MATQRVTTGGQARGRNVKSLLTYPCSKRIFSFEKLPDEIRLKIIAAVTPMGLSNFRYHTESINRAFVDMLRSHEQMSGDFLVSKARKYYGDDEKLNLWRVRKHFGSAKNQEKKEINVYLYDISIQVCIFDNALYFIDFSDRGNLKYYI